MKIAPLFFLLLTLSSLAYGQNDIISQDTPKNIYVEYLPVSYREGNGLLFDVDSHYKETAGFPKSMYRNYIDRVNWAHEMLHAVNGQIGRQHYAEGKHGYYVRREQDGSFRP